MTVVAIDGPAGAGKSTVARAVAKALGWRYLDTGAMYRAVALAAIERGIDPSDADALGRLARESDIELDGTTVFLDGHDVGDAIRRADVTQVVSEVSAHAPVRAALVDHQRRLAATSDVVMEGRDIGTEVFPDAAVKIFLTASLRERARRRCEESGVDCNDETLAAFEASIAARDAADVERAASPLRRAPDAIEIDSSGRDATGIAAAIVAAVRGATDV